MIRARYTEIYIKNRISLTSLPPCYKKGGFVTSYKIHKGQDFLEGPGAADFFKEIFENFVDLFGKHFLACFFFQNLACRAENLFKIRSL